MNEGRQNSGWTKVAFGDVVKLNKDRVSDPEAKGIERFVGLEHIEPENLHIRRWGLVKDGTTFTSYFKPGQVLFGKRRAYQRKVAVADFDGVCSGDIYVFEPKDDRLLLELLPFICQTESFFNHAVGTSAGSLSPRTNWKQLANYEFALPPLVEQQRIARGLRAIEKTVVLRQNLLNTLSELRASLAANIAKTATGSVRFTKNAEPLSGWKLCALDEICIQIVDCLHRTPNYVNEGIPAIRTTDVSQGNLDLENAKRVSQEEYVIQTSRLEPQPEDILYTREAPMGHAATVPRGLKLCISQRMMHLRCNPAMDSAYIMEMLNSQFVQDQVARFAIGSTVLHINVADVKRLLVPIPDLSEQRTYAMQIGITRKAIQSNYDRLTSLQLVKTELLSTILDKNSSHVQ